MSDPVTSAQGSHQRSHQNIMHVSTKNSWICYSPVFTECSPEPPFGGSAASAAGWMSLLEADVAVVGRWSWASLASSAEFKWWMLGGADGGEAAEIPGLPRSGSAACFWGTLHVVEGESGPAGGSKVAFVSAGAGWWTLFSFIGSGSENRIEHQVWATDLNR